MTTLETLTQNLHERPLPAGWRTVALGDVCNINPSRPADLARADDEPTSFVPMDAVDAVSGTIHKPMLRRFGEVKKGYTYFAEGDVLFAKITPCMQNGKHAIARGLADGIGFGTTEFHVLRPSDSVSAEWIYFFIRQPEFLNKATEQFTGAVGQQRLPPGYLQNYPLPLAPLPEQKRIAATLREQIAAVEKARAAAKARLEAAMALRGSMLRTIFTGACAAKWQRVPLSNIADIVSGIQKSPNRRPVDFHRPFLTVRNVQRGSLDLAVVERFEVTPAELARLRLCLGDILIVEGNGSVDQIGRNAIFDVDSEEWIHQNHIIRVRLNPSTSSYRFISHFLNSQPGKDQMVEKAQTTSGLYTLSSGKVGALEVPHPPLAIQREVVKAIDQRLGAFNTITSATADEMAAIDALPAAILRRAFAGDL